MAPRHSARRGGFRGRAYYAPRTVYVEPAPLAPCCACCGNVSNDPTCRACGVPSSANAGELAAAAAPMPAPSTGTVAQAQGAGAGVVLLVLGLFFALKKDRAFF